MVPTGGDYAYHVESDGDAYVDNGGWGVMGSYGLGSPDSEDEYNSAYYTHPIGDVIDIPWYIGTDSCGISFTPRKISAFALRTSATATATVHILWIRMVMSSASTVGMS